jgi:hypothetical protein
MKTEFTNQTKEMGFKNKEVMVEKENSRLMQRGLESLCM